MILIEQGQSYCDTLQIVPLLVDKRVEIIIKIIVITSSVTKQNYQKICATNTESHP